MSKTTKRWLGIAIATVLIVALGIAGFVMASTPAEEPVCYLHGDVNGDGIVSKDDAIYLLYASFPGLSGEFPLQNDGKINDDDVIDKDDAIYLLYASFPDADIQREYPLKGEVHSYYDPTWTWDETAGTAKITFKCGCGGEHVEDAVMSSEHISDPTCVAAGSTKLIAKVTYNGTEYTDTKTIVIPADGEHDLNEANCTTDLQCKNCDYHKEASGHSFALISTTPASCTAAGEEVYKCSACPETKRVALEQTQHQLSYIENGDIAGNEDCQFIKQYKCSGCNGVFDGTGANDVYTKHTYVTTLTSEATCTENGLKTTACSVCGDVKGTETVDKDPSKHAWDNGAESSGKITFTCKAGCGTTRTEVIASQDGAVDTANLDAETGVNLGNASVALDQNALESLQSSNIIIKVEEKDKTTIGLDAEKAEQIRGNTVYDFTMTYDDKTPVTNFGTGLVTVTLPYELEPGEDINSIDIWYIDGNGNPQQVAGAVYSNGYVTFQTSHFSYYTVTRLTPVERCARLGSHIEITHTKAATCTEDGYDMVVCQRCGTVTSKTIHSKTGHNYTDSLQEATCDQEGKLTQTCSNGTCGHTVTKTIPAKGHKMATDTAKTVAATCSAAGKTVKFCENGCGYTTEEPTVQLTHKYEKSDEKSLKATCSSAGYDIFVCSLCGDEVKKNETAPLGHNYPDALVQWSWTDDSTAVATLVCENDSSHTKVLDAVVTKNDDKSQNTSCLGGGSTVYEAAVGYNNKTYTSTNEITVDAPGHKPGVAWNTSDTMHYHLCTVCGEKQDSAGHAWDGGAVTKAPTCVDAGSKTVSCTVCGYSKDQAVPATGEHAFEKGKCTVCGFVENSCRHLPTNEVVIDSASHGLCQGTVFFKYTCDCGEVVEYGYESDNCNYGEEVVEKGKDQYGFSRKVYTATCEDCGMVRKESYYYEVDPECCRTELVNSTEYSVDGTVVASVSYSYQTLYHLGVTVVDTVVLDQEGLCAPITITFKKCLCGKYQNTSEDSECQWGWAVGEGLGENRSYGMCQNCSATRDIRWTYTSEPDNPCMQIENNVVGFYFNKQQLISYEEQYGTENHDAELVDYELVGKTCEDGVLASAKCTKCGKVEDGFYRGHEQILVETIDISAFGLCSDTLAKTTCACEEKYSACHLVDEGNGGCYLNWAWDKETGKEFQICYKCGVKQYEDITYGEKDEYCMCATYTTNRFVDGKGQLVAEVNTHGTVSKHNTKWDAKLAEGATSCEDGIEVREYCADCPYEYSYTNDYHENFLLAAYDLSVLGGCEGRVEIRGCLCGEDVNYEFYGECDFRWVESNVANQEQYQCIRCGIVRTVNTSRAETDNECMTRVVDVYTFSKEGVEKTVRFSTERTTWNHRYIFEMVLNEGATNCYQGGKAIGTCTKCGDVYETSVYTHNAYRVRCEEVSNGKMCGKVEIEEYQCACGLNSGSNIRWEEGKHCRFTGGTYSSELETWMYTCDACGSYYYYTDETSLVEGTTCNYRTDNITHYCDKDGNELFTYCNEYHSTRHDYAVSFLDANGNVWAGKSCSEGFYIVNTCKKCGTSNQSEELITSCETYVTEKEVLLDSDDVCGPVTLVKGSCPCGAKTSADVDYDCRFNHFGYDDKGCQIMACDSCGLKMTNSWQSVRRPGTCIADANMKYEFYRDDTLVAQVDEDYITDQHVWVYTYSNKPTSCEEGWSATYSCFMCGKYGGSYEDAYHHNRNTVAYYDLSKYGMCNGLLEVDSCACGEKTNWEFTDTKCAWSWISESKDGVVTYHCEECNTYCYRTKNVERGENCYYRGTERLQFVRNDQTVLDLSPGIAYQSHEYTMSDAVLVDPDASCEAGVNVVMKCKYCDYSYISRHDYHWFAETDKVETSCGTVYTRNECLCGEYSNVVTNTNCSFNQLESKDLGDEYNGSELYHVECSQCGVNVRRETSWSMVENSCRQQRQGVYTIIYGDERWGLEYQNDSDRHTWGESFYELEAGATDCNGHLKSVQRCKYCSETDISHPGYGHYMNKIATLDLKDFGATCGGELYVYQCPCKATGRYSLNEDSLCKLQKQETDLWIEDVLDNVSMASPGGTSSFYSDAWTFTCAVTEPACSLKLRMAEYWKVKGCVATEYQCWQYLDNKTGEWVEIATVATGEESPYHAYTVTKVDTTEDGAKVTGTKYDCECGSYYHSLKYTYENGTYKTVTDAKDTTGKDFYSATKSINEYMYLYKNNVLQTKCYYEYAYRSGGSYWSERSYEYNFENACEVTTTYTDKNGEPSVTKRSHIEGGEDRYITLKASTCTQPGKMKREVLCTICDDVMNYHIYNIDPDNHWWSENEGIFTCNRCGLENTNGASEGIIIEDFTEAYGNGTHYVAGYWNKDEVEFVNSVCVIIEGQEPQYLEGIICTEHSELNAICFDKELADTEAAKIAGDAAYELRLNFVTNEGERMEYAITFTNDAAQ